MTPSEDALVLLDGLIAVATEGLVVVTRETVLRPADEPLRRSFEATLTRLDRLLAAREKLARHAAEVTRPGAPPAGS